MHAFRKVCRFLHRELGWVAVGLTLVYALSGVAVNHKHDWNPNYTTEIRTWRIEPVPAGTTPEIVSAVLAALQPPEEVRNTWRSTPREVQVYVEGATYYVLFDTGEVRREGFSRRAVFNEVNALHLNVVGGKAWIWVADVFAGVLVILALTGIFLVRGRKGLIGRGGVLLLLGILLPLVFLWLER